MFNQQEMEPKPLEGTKLPWFALSVKSRYERIAATFLENRGYESFLPMYKSRRLWSDRIKELDVPLFPGYLFCRFDIYKRLPVLIIPGVLGIVGGTKLPTPIEIDEISALQATVRAGLSREPWPFLHIGDRVRIKRGSLAGVEGILVQVKGRHRLILSVTLLQRSVAVDIDSAWVSALDSRSRRPQNAGLVHAAPSQATA
jgi:transcription antitermination factor NusG